MQPTAKVKHNKKKKNINRPSKKRTKLARKRREMEKKRHMWSRICKRRLATSEWMEARRGTVKKKYTKKKRFGKNACNFLHSLRLLATWASREWVSLIVGIWMHHSGDTGGQRREGCGGGWALSDFQTLLLFDGLFFLLLVVHRNFKEPPKF